MGIKMLNPSGALIVPLDKTRNVFGEMVFSKNKLDRKITSIRQPKKGRNIKQKQHEIAVDRLLSTIRENKQSIIQDAKNEWFELSTRQKKKMGVKSLNEFIGKKIKDAGY